MPPKGRGRGRGGKGRAAHTAQSVGTVKRLLEVRESSVHPLFQGMHAPDGLKMLEDKLVVFKELLPPKMANVNVTLDTDYKLLDWMASSEHPFKGVLCVETKSGQRLPKHAYQKRIALLDPYRWMKYNERPSTPFFWQFSGSEINTPENQAYIDIVASYLVHRMRVSLNSPHFCEFYGAFRAIAECYLYNLEDDLEDFRFTKWFWDALDSGTFGLRVTEKSSGKQLSREEIHALLRPDADLLTNSSDSDSGSDGTDDSESLDDDTTDSLGAESLFHLDTSDGHTSTAPQDIQLEEVSSLPSDDGTEECVLRKGPGSIHTLRTLSTASDGTAFSDDYTVFAELYDMPVAVMFLEQMEGAMDDLLESKLHTPLKTVEQKQIWTAWLFQVCAALTQLQNSLHLTHNDLHTNNVLWKSTHQPYLWYKGGGKIWKVPTYGKIFTVIDYGRAIFTLNCFTCVSSDYDDGHDAAGMYNFGPLLDPSRPKVNPNTSFDLCRLACSLLRALYPQTPSQLEKGKILSREGNWIIRETQDDLFNMLWSWLVDIDQSNILGTEFGDEKYPGFDLYQVIAATVKSAVPEEQLKKSVFTHFQWKGEVPEGQLYSNLS